MKAIDIGQELQELVANEELLAFFDFLLPTDGGPAEGLCKISRPRERRSRSTYLSIFFVVDAQNAATLRAVEGRMACADWTACGTAIPGVDIVVPIPHRTSTPGLFLKEIDVYLDGSRAPDAAFVRDVLQPGLAQAIGLSPGELTVWEETATAAARPDAPPGSVLARLRRFAGGA